MENRTNEANSAPLVAGTPVEDYPGVADPSTAIPTTRKIHKALARDADALLGWAKRAAFALLGALISTLLHSDATEVRGLYSITVVPLVALVALTICIGIAYLIERASHQAQWAVIAGIFALIQPIVLYDGLWRWVYFSNNREELFVSGVSFSGEYDKGVLFLIIALLIVPISVLATLKALTRWRAAIGVVLVGVSLAGWGSAEYNHGLADTSPYIYHQHEMSLWGGLLGVVGLLVVGLCLYHFRPQDSTSY